LGVSGLLTHGGTFISCLCRIIEQNSRCDKAVNPQWNTFLIRHFPSFETLLMYIYALKLLQLSTDKYNVCGPGSSVGIATDYGVDGPGIE
jgi:hypothetical protein